MITIKIIYFIISNRVDLISFNASAIQYRCRVYLFIEQVTVMDALRFNSIINHFKRLKIILSECDLVFWQLQLIITILTNFRIFVLNSQLFLKVLLIFYSRPKYKAMSNLLPKTTLKIQSKSKHCFYFKKLSSNIIKKPTYYHYYIVNIIITPLRIDNMTYFICLKG